MIFFPLKLKKPAYLQKGFIYCNFRQKNCATCASSPGTLGPGDEPLVSVPGLTPGRGQGQPPQGPGDPKVRQGASPLLSPS